MKYQDKRFTVPASTPKRLTCEPGQHPMADRKGRCLRCGEIIRDMGFATQHPDLDDPDQMCAPSAEWRC